MQREHITNHKELLDFAVNTINNNHKSNGVHVVCLKLEANFSLKLSNSHSCPIDGQTNWGGNKKDAPRHYQGWGGRVWVIFNKRPDSFGNINNSLIHSGTGGYGNYDYGDDLVWNKTNRHFDFKEHKSVYPLSWDCKVFIDDLPKILAIHKATIKANTIKGHQQNIRNLLLSKPSSMITPFELADPLSLLYIKE